MGAGGRILAVWGQVATMNMKPLTVAAALVLAGALPASAQSVTIQFQNGMVNVNAQNAPVRTILAEWARVGGAKVVNAERIAGTPLTLELTNVTEREALNVLLRNVSGYIVGARDPGSVGASSYDRIVILPTSTPPRVTAAAPPTFAPAPQPIVFAPGDPDENPPDDVPPGQGNVPAGTVTPAQIQQRVREAQARAAAAQAEAEAQEDQAPAPAATPARGGNPFGTIRGSSRPGEITPVPQQQQPRNPLRPNGDPEP
jgi:hypothetical protein